MNTAQISNFFNNNQRIYQQYEKNIPYVRNMVTTLVKSLERPLGSVLEIGAGQGRFTIALSAYSDSILATDIADRPLAILQKKTHLYKLKNIQVKVFDVTTINEKLSDKQFNTIVGFLVLHHIPVNSYKSIAKGFYRVLRKKSRICFIEPNCLCPIFFLAILLRSDMPWYMEKQTYTNFLGLFIDALRREKFTVRTAKKIGFLPPQVLNVFPQLQFMNSIAEHLPLINHIICPFTLIVAEKNG